MLILPNLHLLCNNIENTNIGNLLEKLGVGGGAELVLVSLGAQHGQGVGVGVAAGADRGCGHRPGRRQGRLGGIEPGGRGAPGRGGPGGRHARGRGPGRALAAHLKQEFLHHVRKFSGYDQRNL